MCVCAFAKLCLTQEGQYGLDHLLGFSVLKTKHSDRRSFGQLRLSNSEKNNEVVDICRVTGNTKIGWRIFQERSLPTLLSFVYLNCCQPKLELVLALLVH